jgi:hypothetical protein
MSGSGSLSKRYGRANHDRGFGFVPVVDHLVDPLAADLRNAGSPFDKLTARQAPP